MALFTIILMSWLAFWKQIPVVFMIVAGISMLLGLNAPDTFSSAATTTDIDKTLGLAFIGYSLFCIGAAYKCMFWQEEVEDE